MRLIDRINLATPIEKILAWYESNLVFDVLMFKQGALMLIAIPLARKR